MSTVAEQLRAAREAANLTVEHVADRTKMRKDYVRALESGQYDVFSAPVYIRGFIRTYSTMLKLDTSDLLRQLDAELGHEGRLSEGPPSTGRSQGLLDFATLQLSKLDWQKSLIVIVVLTVLLGGTAGFFMWRKAKTNDPLKDLKPALYNPGHNTAETLPLPR